MTVTLDSNGNPVRYNRQGGPEVDIEFARIQHTATQVVVYTRYRQLTVPKQYAIFAYRFHGNNHHTVLMHIFVQHGRPQGVVEFDDKPGRGCAVSSHINYAADSVSMRLTRGCIYRPKYVRVTQLSEEIRYRPDGTGTTYYDSPSRNGGTENQVWSSVTPWVMTG